MMSYRIGSEQFDQTIDIIPINRLTNRYPNRIQKPSILNNENQSREILSIESLMRKEFREIEY